MCGGKGLCLAYICYIMCYHVLRLFDIFLRFFLYVRHSEFTNVMKYKVATISTSLSSNVLT